MADTLEIFGVEYTNVTGIIAKDDNGDELTFTRGGGGVTVTDVANTTGTTCVITTGSEPTPSETWETLEEGGTNVNSDTPYNMIWLSDLGNVYPTAGTVYRITIDGSQYRCTAQQATTSVGTLVCVGNPKYTGGLDDGSSVPFNFYNAGWGAWVGDTELSVGTIAIKIERLVTT